MQIVIDQTLIEGYAETLAGYQQTLASTRTQLAEMANRADRDRMLTIEQACAYLGVGEDSLLYYRNHGLEYYKKGRAGVWYRKGDIDDWLATGKVSRHK